MSSLILDLQRFLLDPESDIQNLLRKAHAVAYKLGIAESNKWLQFELNGYDGVPDSEVPEYRKLHGRMQVKNPMRGWIPFQFNDEKFEKALCGRILTSPISELISLCRQNGDGTIGFYLPDELSNKLCQLTDSPIPMQCAVHLGKHQVETVIDRVRNRLLEWTLELEKQGIMGEGLMFSVEETAAAKSLPQPIVNYYGNVVQGDVSSSQLISGNRNVVEYNYKSISDAISEIREKLENEPISQENKEQIMELVGEVDSKIKAKKKPGLIKASIVGLKDFCISTGANVVAAIIAKQMYPGS